MKLLKKYFPFILCSAITIMLCILCFVLFMYMRSYSLLYIPKEHCLIEKISENNSFDFLCPDMVYFHFCIVSEHPFKNNITGFLEIKSKDEKQQYKEKFIINNFRKDMYNNRYIYEFARCATNHLEFLEKCNIPILIVLNAGETYKINLTIENNEKNDLSLLVIGSTYKKHAK